MKRSKGMLVLLIVIACCLFATGILMYSFVYSYLQFSKNKKPDELIIPFAKTQNAVKRLSSITANIPPLNARVTSKLPISVTSQNNYMDSRAIAIFDAINRFRSKNGLVNLSTNNTTCSFAQIRAVEIVNNFNHNGFQQRITNHSLPYERYSEIVENLAFNNNFLNVTNSWIMSPAHKENLLRNLQFGCIGDAGSYFTFEGLL